ncbi:MAG: molybdopterin-dependent oxidoreductase [Gammaproteobacteria bacterium]|nr:molybdopterin-dependent oxidoreductase [Gammaproteobacteria bacterium]
MLNRRDIFKYLAGGGVGVGTGLLLGEVNQRPLETLLSTHIPPEDFSPGMDTWYNTLCRMCPAGCGISVRVREGRAKKIEGNPNHPVSRGGTCALGQASLNALYNPDRLRSPMRSDGEGGFVESSWKEAFEAIAPRLGALQSAGMGGRTWILTGGFLSSGEEALDKFREALGANVLRLGLDTPATELAAAKAMYGFSGLPHYDIGSADLVVSFGADFLGAWRSPVGYSKAYGEFRQGGDGHRGYLVQVEPRMSLTGANADEWLPARPGTEGALALALGAELLGRAGPDDEPAGWEGLPGALSLDEAAALADLPAERLRALADRLAAAKTPLVLGGGAVGAGANATEALTCVAALNRILGAAGTTVRPNLAHAPRFAALSDIENFVAEAANGEVSLVIVAGVDPLHDLPHSLGLRGALDRAELVVALDSFPSDTASAADWILATDTFFETWDDDISLPGNGKLSVTLQQPVQRRLYDTLSVTDIVLQLAQRSGGALAEALPYEDAEAYTRSEWATAWTNLGIQDDFDAGFRQVQQQGVWVADLVEGMADEFSAEATVPAAPSEAQFAGDASEYPFVLHPFQTPGLREGKGARLPWIQELPDPQTSVAYGSWVEVSPATADELNLRDGDVVEVSSPAGTVSAPVLRYPGVRPDVIAMPLGQGHQANGRYAQGRGVNPASLIAARSDGTTGALAWAATRVALRKTGERVRMTRTSGVSRTLGRQILGPEDEH